MLMFYDSMIYQCSKTFTYILTTTLWNRIISHRWAEVDRQHVDYKIPC